MSSKYAKARVCVEERPQLGHALKTVARGLALAAGLLVGTSASNAAADGKVVTISEVTIVGRIQKPIAAVDVSRIQPKMTLAELRQPFLDRIEKAVYLSPF